MTNKFKNKYRIASSRLKNWNYGAMGAYFITICTKNRERFFGEIVTNEIGEKVMILNDIGKKVEAEWLRTLEIRPDMNLELGNFVVMSNHFHGILVIGNNEFNSETDSRCRDAMHRVSTNKFGPQSKNLGSIMRGFKSSVTTFSKINTNIDFGWQERFHDHIIRNSAEFERIQHYIENNVANWEEDKFYNLNVTIP